MKEKLSVREQIALKRAEAKKAQTTGKGGSGLLQLEDLGEDQFSSPTKLTVRAEEPPDELGRLGIRETISKARSTGVFLPLVVCRVLIRSSFQAI